jgi:arylsulfatase A-like enzyme
VLRSYTAPSDPADLATLVSLYDAEIAFTDDHVGRLIAGIQDDGRPTLIVVTADHGEEFGDHGRLLHGVTLWEEQLRVPLVVAGVGVPSGVVMEDAVSLVSLWASVAELAGLPRPPRGTGPSLASFVSGSREASAPVFADLERPSPGLDHFHRRAMLDGDWKLVETTDDGRKLFHVKRDPRERTDLVSAEPDRSKTLTTMLHARNVAATVTKRRLTPGTAPVSAERRERLKALGYAQ